MEAASKKTVEELVTFAGATAKVIVVKAKETRAPVGASSVAGVTVVNDAPKVTLAATGTAASAAGKVKHTLASAVDSAGDTASGAVERRQGAFARVTAAVGSAIEKDRLDMNKDGKVGTEYVKTAAIGVEQDDV